MMTHMGAITKTLLTFEEFEQLPERPGKQELLRGELIELPPAPRRHNEASHEIFGRLNLALTEAHARGEGAELGRVFIEMGYKLPTGSYVQPDVSVTFADQPGDDYFEGSPAVAIEVVSPSNTAEELDLKTELYFEFGAREVWRFYPRTRHVVVHLPGKSHVVREDETLTTALLPGFALRVGDILGPTPG
jgi:Uma2 family endonuclease